MISSYTIEGVSGQEDALGTLTLTDVSGEPRDDITVALQENYDPENPEPLRLEAHELEELSGTLSGEYIEGVTTANWVALASTGEQPHVGRWRVYARVEVGANVSSNVIDSLVRLSYRSGDGPLGLTDRPAVTPHLAGDLIELDLGLVNIREVEGTHAWSGQVEIRGATAGLDFKLRELLFMPATNWARVRAPVSLSTPTTLEARDEFDQSAGALAGKTLPVGGSWTGAGDTDDFTVEATGHTAQRAVGSDAINVGRFAIAGATSYTNIAVQIEARVAEFADDQHTYGGPTARYVDADNWLWGCLTFSHSVPLALVRKNIAGAITEYSVEAGALSPGAWYSMLLMADADGRFAFWWWPTGSMPGTPALAGHDADLATGGVLASGKTGFGDYKRLTEAPTRNYDNFAAWVPEVDHVIHPDESLRLTHSKAERENADGTRWGRVPHFEGARLKVPPSTRNGYAHRLVVKQDVNDLTQFPVGTEPPPELCTNPSAETDTTGWTNTGLTTFERVTSLPTHDGLPAGVTTGFHAVGDTDNDRATDSVAVEDGKTYVFSAYVRLASLTAPAIKLLIRNSASVTVANSTDYSTVGGNFARLSVTFTATETATWTFRVQQTGAGAADWHFTAVSIRQVLLTPTLTVRPRVLLASG